MSQRLKAVCFVLIALPGRVVQRARRLIIRLGRGHPSYDLLLRARRGILALAACPTARRADPSPSPDDLI